MKPRSRLPRVDWFRVVINIERTGMSDRAIAEQLGMSHGWLKHTKNSPGAEPRFDDGNALLDLWAEVMDKPPEDAPRELPSINRP